MDDIRTGQGLVKHWVLTVVAECPYCGEDSTVMLVNAIRVACAKCGAVVVLSSFHLGNAEHPESALFGIDASEPTIKQVLF